MGYCIEVIETRFHVRAGDKPAALKALAAMWAPRHRPDMGGGSGTERWYSWMNDTTLARGCCPDLETALAEWGYPVDTDQAGNIVAIRGNVDKLGDERLMFAALAPWVRAGSYLVVRGEDGAMWRWYFDGRTMVEQAAHVSVSFEEEDDR